MIAPVMVCVVETGSPKAVAAKRVSAPPVSGAEALHRREPRDLRAHRVDNPPAAEQRTQRHGRLAGQDHPERHVEGARGAAVRVEQHRDDAHGLLRVVAAVAEGIERGGDELELAKHPIDRDGVDRTNSHETIRTRSSANTKPRAGESTMARSS